jgi:capsular polysaccharide transport system permease protein
MQMRALSIAGAGTTLLRGLKRQARVISALMIREAMSRYGHESLGFFWVMGEPLLLTSGVMVLWTISNQTHGSGVGVIPFTLTGYSMLTLWRHIVFKSVHGMRYNASLTFHAQVQFLDILLARALLETIGVLAAFFIAYMPLYCLDLIMPLRDPLVFFGGWFLTAWFAFGFGLCVAALSELNETFERVIQPAMYITLPLTGAFYMVDWMPLQAREVLLWSPLVQGMEMFRGGLFPADIPTEWDPVYLFACAFGTMAIGLPLCLYAQKHVQMP